MIRLKWITLKINANLDTLADFFINQSFNRSSSSGFVLNLINNEYIEGEFVQRTVHKETIIRPDSSEEIIEIERFNYINFKICHLKMDVFLVELKNPPRSLSDFLNFIHSRLTQSMIAMPVELDVMNILNGLRRNDKLTATKIKKIKASSIKLSLRSSATIEVQSHENAYKELLDNFPFESIIIDYVNVSASHNGKKVNFSIKKTGLSSDSIEVGHEVKKVIIEDLSKLDF